MTTTESQALGAQQCWLKHGWMCSAPSTVSGAVTSWNTKMFNEGEGSQGPDGTNEGSHSREGVPQRGGGHFIGA